MVRVAMVPGGFAKCGAPPPPQPRPLPHGVMPRSISQQLTTFRLDQPGLTHVVDTQRQQDSMLRQLIDVQSQLIQNQQFKISRWWWWCNRLFSLSLFRTIRWCLNCWPLLCHPLPLLNNLRKFCLPLGLFQITNQRMSGTPNIGLNLWVILHFFELVNVLVWNLSPESQLRLHHQFWPQ